MTFPDLLEKDMEKRIGAIIDAATLKGQPLTTMTLRKVTRLLLVELGVEDVDEMLDEMIPVDNEIDPNQTEDESEVMGEAIRELREAVIELAKKTA